MSDLDFTNFEQEPQKPQRGNKTFMVIAGILAAIILVAIVAAAAYAILVLPRQNAARAEQAIQINAQNTATVMAVTAAALTEMAPTETPLPTDTPEPTASPEPTATPEPTMTPEPKEADVIAIGGGMDEEQAITATVSALLTMAAGGKPQEAAVTAVAGTDPNIAATALPTTGFIDEIGIPSVVGLGFLFILLIIVTRRARMARSH